MPSARAAGTTPEHDVRLPEPRRPDEHEAEEPAALTERAAGRVSRLLDRLLIPQPYLDR